MKPGMIPILHWPCSSQQHDPTNKVRWRTYGSDDTGAVGANHARLALGLEHICDTDHVYFCQPVYHSVLVRFIPCCGIPSVILCVVSLHIPKFDIYTYVTIRGTSALMASSILAAATGGLQ